eukprot:441998-Ditylum_brightwellii.AAC.1
MKQRRRHQMWFDLSKKSHTISALQGGICCLKACNDKKNNFTYGGTACLTGCDEGETMKKQTSKKVVYCNLPYCSVGKDAGKPKPHMRNSSKKCRYHRMLPCVKRDSLVGEVKKYLVQINEPIVPFPL